MSEAALIVAAAKMRMGVTNQTDKLKEKQSYIAATTCGVQ